MDDSPRKRSNAVAQDVQPGNAMPLGRKPSPNSTLSREDEIIDKTKSLAFPTGGVISMENFEHKGDMPAGFQNSVANMEMLSGKQLQESYRAGFPESAKYTDKVNDR
jgi:hypothetical protein